MSQYRSYKPIPVDEMHRQVYAYSSYAILWYITDDFGNSVFLSIHAEYKIIDLYIEPNEIQADFYLCDYSLD